MLELQYLVSDKHTNVLGYYMRDYQHYPDHLVSLLLLSNDTIDIHTSKHEAVVD